MLHLHLYVSEKLADAEAVRRRRQWPRETPTRRRAPLRNFAAVAGRTLRRLGERLEGLDGRIAAADRALPE